METEREHDVKVFVRPAPKSVQSRDYQARCSCGWTSERFVTEAVVEEKRDEHLEAVEGDGVEEVTITDEPMDQETAEMIQSFGAAPQDADAEGGQSETDVVLDLYPQTEDARGETAHADDALIRAAIRRARKSSHALGRDALAAYERLLTFKRRAARRLRRGGGEPLDVAAEHDLGSVVEGLEMWHAELADEGPAELESHHVTGVRQLLKDAHRWIRLLRDAPEERPGGSGERGELDAGEGTLTVASSIVRNCGEPEIASALLDLRDRLRRSTPEASREELVKIARDHMPATVGFGEHTWDEQAEKIVDEILERLDHPAPDSEADGE